MTGVLPASDAAHIVKRSAGGADALHNLLHLCRAHHAMEDRPYAQGRLVYYRVWSWGQEAAPDSITSVEAPTRCRWRVERRARKGAPLLEVLAEGLVDLREKERDK